ncbi:uncharacterized protein LOC144110976 [Amblyomma americanum]
MAAACSPPCRRVGGSREEDVTSSPVGSKVGPTDATPERPFSRNAASPEDSCAICLGAPENKSFTDSCFHTFCFACLAEWAKVKAECPLCKQRFKSIIHSVRSLEDYDQYFVSELQRPPGTVIEVYDRRFRFPTTMTVERRQEIEAMRQEQERRARQPSIAPQRNHSRYLPRGAITSAARLELYIHGLWAVPHAFHYREASPEFYRENPACTHRLVPWLNRELNALMQERRGRIMYAMDYVISLIMEFDIRHPEFARRMDALLHEHTEHFVYEFYSYATSVHDMAAYDQYTVYKPYHLAFAHENPVNRFRQMLLLHAQVAASASHDEPSAVDSPQPGPSGLSVARVEVTASVADADSDSDSSECIVVKVVKPQRERTPVVIDLLSSDEDDKSSAQGQRCECLPEMSAGPSHSYRSSMDHKLPQRHATTDSASSSDDEHLQRRHSGARSPGDSSLARDRGRGTSKTECPLRSDTGRRRQGWQTTRASESWSSSNEDSTRGSWARKRKKNLVQGGSHKRLPKADAGPHHLNQSLGDRWHRQHRAATVLSLPHDEHAQRTHPRTHSRDHSRSARERGQQAYDRGNSLQSDSGSQRQMRHVSPASTLESWRSPSDEDSTQGSSARKPRKLVSVVGAVNIASKSSDREHRRTHHHHHHRHDQRCRKHETNKRKHRRPSPSQEF